MADIIWSILGILFYLILGANLARSAIDIPFVFKDYLIRLLVLLFWPVYLVYNAIFKY
jgi:hypothetical protein